MCAPQILMWRQALPPLRGAVSLGDLDTQVYSLYDRVPRCAAADQPRQHGDDERVNLASLKRVTTAITLSVTGWRGLEPVAASTRAT